MTDPNTQRVALVTGGAIRVGRAITLALAEADYDVVISYHSSEVAAQETREAVEVRGGVARPSARTSACRLRPTS